MTRAGLLVLFSCLMLAISGPFAHAQQPAAPPPEKIAELMKILDDPAVRAWVNTKGKSETEVQSTDEVIRSGIQKWEANARSNFRGLLAALPTLPGEFAAATGRIRAEARDQGFMPVAAILAVVLLAALIGEWIVRRIIHHRPRENPLVTRTVIELVPLAAFTLIAGVFFFSVDWPPLLGAAVFFYLLAAVAFRLIGAVCAMAVAAGSLSPFMFRRILLFSAVLLIAIATSAIARSMSIDPDVGRAVSFGFSLLLLAIGFEAVWRQPASEPQSFRIKALKTFCLLALWLVWAMGFPAVFWVGLYAAVFPKILPSVDRLARAFAATRWPDDPDGSIPTVLAIRGVRALIVAIAVIWLAMVWQYNLRELGSGNTLLDSLVIGLFRSVIVLLVADLGWSLAKAVINRKLASVAGDMPVPPVEAARRARLRTLLPIFRNGLAALVLVITVMMVLAEMGVEIGPLIAGAGIFGVAIGFGSQTLVKDVISGVFYLMDDAFRVGEYIQSGSYMGTVESFSLRSVRLRHHRGAIFTVPFGELGAVQNMSRDWAIDKFLLRVNFDADVAKAKRLVKAIGAELLEDPELGPQIIQTLKMKGVEQIGEFGIELSFAFTAVPGQQSVIRRRAYTMIRKAFVENGIGFAQPTVQVGGDDKGDAAAAAMKMAAQKKQAEGGAPA